MINKPGDFIKEELEYRGWTQKDLAYIMGERIHNINALTMGRIRITGKRAKQLEAALGPSAEMWMNLQTNYDLSFMRIDKEIRKRAKEVKNAKESSVALGKKME
jgi:HTH-type transcriptional regulator/antitoxin HigA